MPNNDVSFTVRANVAPAVKEVEELSQKINDALTKSVKGAELRGFKKELQSIKTDANELAKKSAAQKLTVGKINKLNAELADKEQKIAEATEKAATSEKDFKDYKNAIGKSGNATKEEQKQLAVKEAAYKQDKEALKELKSERTALKRRLSTAKDTYNKQTKYADEYLAKYKEYEEKADAILNPEAYKLAKAEAEARAKSEKESSASANKSAEEISKASESEAELVKNIKSATSALDEQEKAAKQANEEVTKSKKSPSTKIPAQEDIEGDEELTEARKNEILELVKTIYELRQGEQDATKETEKLQRMLFSFAPATADVGELARFIHDVKQTSQFISSDLSNTEKLDDVFRDLARAAVPASQAFTELNNSFKSNTMSAEAERKALEEVLNAGEYVAKLNLDTTGKDFAEIAQSLAILQSAESIAKKLGVPDEVKGQYNEITRAIIRLKDAQSTLKKEVTTPTSEKQLDDYRKAMQSVIDTTDRINNVMRFDGAQTGIAELIRRLTSLKEAKKTLEDFGLPREMDARYEMINQLIAKTTAQINAYKQSLKEVAQPADNAGKASERAGKSAEKAANQFKLGSTTLKTLKSGFKDMSRLQDKVKSSFNKMANNMRSNFKHLITSITKYVLGFRSLFFLVRRLRKYVGEGIKNLVQFNNGNNLVNESITDLLSSLLFLKNAWAAAFSPIITVVRPMLVDLLDTLAEVGNAIARFLGSLLGAKVTFNAVRVPAQDYAESLGGVGDSAGGAADKVKKLTDRLADFDDLDVLGRDNDDDKTGSGGGGGAGDLYEPDPNEMFTIVDDEVNSFLEALKKAWKNKDFTQVGTIIKDKILSLFPTDDDWAEIQEKANTFGKGIGEFLVGLLGDPELFEKSGHTIGQALNTIIGGIASLLEELDKIPFGSNAAAGVNEFLSTTDWQLAGENIGNVLSGITTNITDFVNNLDSEKVAIAISDFVEGINIPELAANVTELAFRVTRLFIEVTGEMILQASDRFAELLTKWASQGVTTSYVDKNGVHVDLQIEPTIDWTKHPVQALFEALANAIGAVVTRTAWYISIIFGFDWDLGEFIAQADHAFESTGVNDFFDNIEQGFFKTMDLITGWDVASTTAEKFDDTLAHSAGGFSTYSDNVTTTTNSINEFSSAAVDLKNQVTNVSNVATVTATNINNLGVSSQQATDTMVTGFTSANETVSGFGPTIENASVQMTTYNSNVAMAVEQSNENLNSAADTTSTWSTTVTGAVGDTANSWDNLGSTVSVNGDTFVSVVSGIGDEASRVQVSVTGDFSDMATGISDSTNSLSTSVNTTWETLGEDVPIFADDMAALVYASFVELETNTITSWDNIKTTIVTDMADAKAQASTSASDLNTSLSGLFLNTQQEGSRQFDQMANNIVGSFAMLAADIKSPLNRTLDAIEGMVNHSITAINALFNAVREAASVGDEWLTYMDLPKPNVPGNIGYVSIPRLAQGAVIPPNKEFMAVLGDQSHGTNVEAPLDTIKQAVAEVLANNGNQEVIELLQQLIRVVESKNLTIGDKDIGKANARYSNQQRIIRGTSF